MPQLLPDQTFYPSPALAMKAPAETLAYVALLNPDPSRPDALAVVDVDADSPTFGAVLHRTEMPSAGDELHHFGWNACSSCLCPYSPHPHMERRYLVVPGMRSSRIHVLDTKPDPRAPRIVHVIEPEEVIRKTGYSRPHTAHCGPDGIYINALGGADGNGPGGIFVLDAETFAIKGRWEKERGPQHLAYDFWWHLGHDTMITSEWGTPNMVEDGVNPELLLGGQYGHALHVWNLHTRKHVQRLELGPEHQMVLELRPAHDPGEAYGFVGVVTSLKDLSASIWTWYREGTTWAIRKVIEIPAEPAPADDLPPLLRGFGAVPPLVSDINLSLDDRYLYVSCWGTGELKQFDVSDPFSPVETGSVRIGGIVRRTPHPSSPAKRLNGAPQMVEVSRDGRRVYVTNSLYRTWDEQFYPDGIAGWLARLDVADDGGMTFDPRCFLEFDGMRPHQVHLEGGDASSDSYCFA
jgi:selenium-binding protein 1